MGKETTTVAIIIIIIEEILEDAEAIEETFVEVEVLTVEAIMVKITMAQKIHPNVAYVITIITRQKNAGG